MRSDFYANLSSLRVGALLLGWLTFPLQAASLADSAAWLALLHFDGRESRIDTPAFFLHPDGRFQPERELASSVLRLSIEPELRCRYPARFAFLKEHRPEFAQLERPACPDYDAWRAKLHPDAATLVFASAYLGNPSSMFGHTFLRLDHGGSPLLAWVVNFAAQTQDPVSMRFAIKGASGGYPGRFGFAPYYEKITEYAHLEQRDLWEYPLKINAAERDRLLAHLWEMREVWFDYYFFQENCSFQLLALLQAVWPELPLTEGFGLFAAPLDTVRRLQQFGLLGEPVWRPAATAALRLKIAGLAPDDVAWLRRSLHERALQPADAVQSQALDVLSALAELRFNASEDPRWAALRKQALTLRSSRSERGRQREFMGVAPDQSHFSQRAGISWRTQAGKRDAVLSWRPVLHDALDGPKGWPRGGEISVLDTRLAIGEGQLALDRLTVFSVAALPRRDAWFQPWSWQLGAGYWRDPWTAQGFVRARGGGGLSYGWSGVAGLRHSYLLHGAVLLGRGEQRALETGLDIKIQGQWQVAWPWLIELQWRRRDGLIEQAGDWWWQTTLAQQWQINQAWAVRSAWQYRDQAKASQFQIGMAHYF